MRIAAKTGLLAAVLGGALTLGACGEATVEDDPATATSVAPLERAPRESASESASTEASESAEATTARPSAEPQPQDQGAREVEEIPEQEVPRSEEDVTFLGDLTDEGIDVAGVEDQLIGTASTVCGGDGNGLTSATLPAVAGQLVEQGRTDKSVDEVAAIVEAAAKNAYC